MNTLFNNNAGRKRGKYDRKIHKAMRILVDIYQTNKKLFVTVQPKPVCKLEFSDNLWMTFIDKPQLCMVVLEIITFRVYTILVHKWKHVIVPNDILSFNEELELNSTSIIELLSIHESSHEESIVIFIKIKT